MAGHPLRIGEQRSSRQSRLPKRDVDGGDRLLTLRRFLLRLALDTHRPEVVLERAVRAISDALGTRCAFVEGEDSPNPAPGHLAVVVLTDSVPVGTLIFGEEPLLGLNIGSADLQELADLVGVSLLNASQAQAVAEMQVDSEDMLFFAPDAIFVLSLDGVVEMANQKALDFLDMGESSVLGRQLIQILGTTLEKGVNWQEIARVGGVLEIETHCRTGTRLAALTLSFVGEEKAERILCVVRDITAERQASLALRRTERSMLMRQAVEYLLHEVNNPLAALISNITLAKKRSNELDPLIDSAGDASRPVTGSTTPTKDIRAHRLPQLKQALQNAESSAKRIRETMAMLRSVYRGDTARSVESVDIAYELALAIGVAEAESSGDVSIIQEIDIQRRVEAPSLAIAEAVGALIKNALQALEGMNSGHIRIWARESADCALITVYDNGPGVSPELREKMFMPFFTTKALGESLGLGLTLAEDTVRRLGGTLKFIPGMNVGATFEMTIPLSTVPD